MKKLLVGALIVLGSTMSHSFDIIQEHRQWDAFCVLDEWGERTNKYVMQYNDIVIMGEDYTINRDNIEQFSNIIYPTKNGLVLSLYRQAEDVIVSTSDKISMIKIRFDKRRIVEIEGRHIEIGASQDEVTGKVYMGHTRLYIYLNNNMIDMMKKHNTIEVLIPYGQFKYKSEISLKGFTKAYNKCFIKNG